MHISNLKVPLAPIIAGILLSGSALAALPADAYIRPTADIASPLDAPGFDEGKADITDTDEISSVPVEEMTPAEFAAVADLSVPSDFSFVLDPLNISGKGQIQSGQYVFENNGSIDLEVTLHKIYYQFPNDVDFRSITSPELLDFSSSTKDLYLYLEQMPPEGIEGEGIKTVLTTNKETTESISFVLSADKSAPNNKVTFTLGGSSSEGTDIWWEDGDIKINVVYTYTMYDADIIDLDELNTNIASPLDAQYADEPTEPENDSSETNHIAGPAGDIEESSAIDAPTEESSEPVQQPEESSSIDTPAEESSSDDIPPASSEAPEETLPEKESATDSVQETEMNEPDSAPNLPETDSVETGLSNSKIP